MNKIEKQKTGQSSGSKSASQSSGSKNAGQKKTYPGRYHRNMETFSREECTELQAKRVCVIGLGGLGGYVVELLARAGVGHIKGVDGDVFDVSNLNRQLFAQEALIGKEKTQGAKERITSVNSEIEFLPVTEFLTEKNGENLIEGYDVVVDALDNINSRLILEEACESKKIPLVHGAIAGWTGQVCVVLPGDNTLREIYASAIQGREEEQVKGEEVVLGNPSFTPALVGSIQVAETIKLLLGKETNLANQILTVNLLNNEFEKI